ILVYYRWRTILLLLPALLLMEMGQLCFSATKGKLWDKLRSYAYYFQRGRWSSIMAQRRRAQATRVIPDRQFLRNFTGSIETRQLDGWLIRYVVNPVFSIYWAIARRLLFW